MCPLCNNQDIVHYHTDKRRRYYQCNRCNLVFVGQQWLPSIDDEQREYALHQNSFDDAGYIRWLSRILDCIPSDIQKDSDKLSALDFGCGPAPVLAAILAARYRRSAYFDPLFFSDSRVLQHSYDLITCTEAIEHFHHPLKEWQLLCDCLNPKGALIVMTKRVLSQDRFANWHYKNDPTHVSFFSESTFSFLAKRDGLSVEFPTSDIAVFRKQ